MHMGDMAIVHETDMRWNKLKPVISLSPNLVAQINESLSNGKDVQIAVRGNKLVYWEISNKKKYEVVVAQPR